MVNSVRWASRAVVLAFAVIAGLVLPLAAQENPASTIDLEKRVRELEETVRQLKEKNASPVSAAPQPSPSHITLPKLPTPSLDPHAEPKQEKPKEFIVGRSLKMEPVWKEQLWFESADKAFRWTVGGVIQSDMTFFGAPRELVQSIGVYNGLVDPGHSLDDGFQFRRARIRFQGILWEQIEFKAMYDFAQSLDLRRRTLGISPAPPPGTFPLNDIDPADNVGFNEVYIGFNEIPLLGTIRVGRQRESLNFITATSDNFQIWMERGLMFDAFNGDFNFSNGITIQRNYFDNRAYSLFGFFHSNNNSNRGFYAVGDGEYAYDGRLTCLPVYDEEGQLWVHVGTDYSYRVPHLDQLRYRARPMIRGGPLFETPNILNTGTLFTRGGQQIANLEFAMAWGRFTFAAEASTSWLRDVYTGGLPVGGVLPAGAVARGNYQAWGTYVEALCFLTPDHRPYQFDRPGYARVVPVRTWYFLNTLDGLFSSSGAWEVGLRYDYLDLNDSNINGGRSNAVTACLNWYFNANARVQCNYSWMDRQFAPPDDAGRRNGGFSSFGIRFNMDF